MSADEGAKSFRTGVPEDVRRDGEALLAAGSRVVDLAAGRGGMAEAYVEHLLTTTIKVYEGRPESITVAEPRGLGVRFIRDGRLGYAYTSDLGDAGVRAAVEAAVAASTAAEPDRYAVLPSGGAERGERGLEGLWLPDVGNWDLDSKVGLAVAAERAALAEAEVRSVEEAVYTDVDRRVAIVSSQGLELWGAATYAVLYVYAHAERDGETRSGLAVTGGRGMAWDLSPEAVGREAGERARELLGAAPCATGAYTVVLDRQVVGALLGALVPALSAEAVQKGRSVFADLLGELVAPPGISLWDDGLQVSGPSAFPFDDEGTLRSGRTALVREGRLTSFLFDAKTAARAGGASTGNAARPSYRALPAPGATNVVVDAHGQGDLTSLVERVGEGLYVCDVSGAHSGINAISGEISVGLSGRLVRGGHLCEPVREVTMATDVRSLLSGIVDAAADQRWDLLHGGILTPSLAVAEVAVSGS